MSTWNCGSKTCPTHREPTHYCQGGVWLCGRRQPPCTTHPKPKVPCPAGTAWHCGSRNCPGIHPSADQVCPVGVWECGRVNKACPGHASRTDHCAIRGAYTVKGLGARKQVVFSSGGNLLDLAVAMLESDNMLVSDYPYGDKKTLDEANFGIFKQNWLMIRSTVKQYANLKDVNFGTGVALNQSLTFDIQVLHASQKHYGMGVFGKWWAGHRGGYSGIHNLWPKYDIDNYQKGVYWIRDEIKKDPRFLSDDTRFWVDVPPV
jgi:hypothetical protein